MTDVIELEDQISARVWAEGEIDGDLCFQSELGHTEVVGSPHVVHRLLHMDVEEDDHIPAVVRGDLSREEITVPWRAKLLEVRVGQHQDGGMGLVAVYIVAPDQDRTWTYRDRLRAPWEEERCE